MIAGYPQYLLLNAEMLFQPCPSHRRDLDGAGRLCASYPPLGAKKIGELNAERAGEMVLPLRPVEALPGETAPARLDRRDLEANACKPIRAGLRYLELFIGCRNEKASLLQPAGDRHADAA